MRRDLGKVQNIPNLTGITRLNGIAGIGMTDSTSNTRYADWITRIHALAFRWPNN